MKRPHFLWALAGCAAVGIFFWHSLFLYPLRLLVVLMHETGHALAALAVGGEVLRIRVMPNEGGVTFSRFAPTLLRELTVSSAGYLGSTAGGCALLSAAARSREARVPLFALAAWPALVALVWVRDPFTLLLTACACLLLGALAHWAPPAVRRTALVFLGAFSVLYALFDIQDDLLHFRSWSGQTDADALARATHVPALAWGLFWGLLSLVMVWFTLRRAPK